MPITQMQNEIITWTDPAGNVTSIPFLFAETGVQAVWGITGRGMPPIADNERATAYQPGAALIFSRHDVREIGLPIEIWAYDITTLRSYERELATALDPVRGYDPATGIVKQGTLSFTLETGITRQITCRLVKGFEWTEDLARGVGFVARAVLVFRASDPYFYDPRTASAQTIAIPAETSPGTYTTSPVTFVNNGSTQAWPIWTVTLPFSSSTSDPLGTGGTQIAAALLAFHIPITITNTTTGEYLTFYLNGAPPNTSLPAVSVAYTGTDTIRIIDTRPNKRTVVNAGGASVLQTLTFQNLFPLAIGDNVITVSVTVPASLSASDGGGHTFSETFATGVGSLSMAYTPGFITL